jgi:hypothetical protein
MLTDRRPQHARSRLQVAWIAFGLLLAGILASTTAPTPIEAQQPEAPAGIPEGAVALLIDVAQVTGDVNYTRRVGERTRVRTVTRATKLQAGDTLHLDVGARCLLLFRSLARADANLAPEPAGIRTVAFRPEAPSTAGDGVAAAVLFRGYSEASIAMAYQHNQAANIQLDMPQGIARASVVPTAVKPRFRIRTPRTVVAVRGTEIRELETSIDRGDILSMGRTGVVASNTRFGLLRSAQAEQGTRKTSGPDRRSGRFVRAINDLIVRTRLVLAGPHKGRFEYDQASREAREVYIFGAGEKLKNAGDPAFYKFLNSGTSDDGRANSPPGSGSEDP